MSQPKRDSDGKLVKAKAAKSAKSSKQSTKQAEKRASFVLRLSLDGQNQIRRSEIQHVQSSKKESYATLDCERLMGFVEGCIGMVVAQETPVNPVSEVEVEPAVAAAAKPETAEALPTTRLSKVELSNGNFVNWINPAEPIQIEVDFVLEGEVKPADYSVQIFARNFASDRSGSSLVAGHSGRLSAGVKQYRSRLEIQQLPIGLHQLSAVVRVVGGPMGYCEGMVVQVNQLRVLPVDTSASRLSVS